MSERAPLNDEKELLLSYTSGRSVPCPRCGYSLCDIVTPLCPECGEKLELKVGSPRVRFGWLLLACAPGCFSGVAALLFAFPIYRSLQQHLPLGRGVPIPVMFADAFGFLSAGAAVAIYFGRERILRWTDGKQAMFAAGVWGVHVLVFIAVVLAMI